MPHRLTFALYATPSEFRTPEISQRGSPPFAHPVAFRCPPPPRRRPLRSLSLTFEMAYRRRGRCFCYAVEFIFMR